MDNKDIFIAAIILGGLLAFFASLKIRKIPINNNIGGCSGTRYGCCPHSRKAKVDERGSNCRFGPGPHRH